MMMTLQTYFFKTYIRIPSQLSCNLRQIDDQTNRNGIL